MDVTANIANTVHRLKEKIPRVHFSERIQSETIGLLPEQVEFAESIIVDMLASYKQDMSAFEVGQRVASALRASSVVGDSGFITRIQAAALLRAMSEAIVHYSPSRLRSIIRNESFEETNNRKLLEITEATEAAIKSLDKILDHFDSFPLEEANQIVQLLLDDIAYLVGEDNPPDKEVTLNERRASYFDKSKLNKSRTFQATLREIVKRTIELGDTETGILLDSWLQKHFKFTEPEKQQEFLSRWYGRTWDWAETQRVQS